MEERGESRGAICSYRKATELKSDFYQARQSLGRLLVEIGKADEAIKENTLPLKHDEKNPALHLNLGKLFLDLNNPSKAVSHLNKAADLMPQDYRARNDTR